MNRTKQYLTTDNRMYNIHHGDIVQAVGKSWTLSDNPLPEFYIAIKSINFEFGLCPIFKSTRKLGFKDISHFELSNFNAHNSHVRAMADLILDNLETCTI